MEDGNLLDFGQTGVIVVNHVMEDLDGELEKGAVPTQVQSMAGKTVLDPIQKQLLKHATHLFVLVCTKHYNYVFTCPNMFCFVICLFFQEQIYTCMVL
jgi:hypothetical protein